MLPRTLEMTPQGEVTVAHRRVASTSAHPVLTSARCHSPKIGEHLRASVYRFPVADFGHLRARRAPAADHRRSTEVASE